jgi:hypothetical protein
MNELLILSMEIFLTSLSWDQVVTNVGSSAIISALVSAGVNYFLTMKQLKKEKEIRFIEDKIGLYSVIIYHLEYIIQWFVNPPSSPTFNSSKLIEEMTRTIDEELKNRFYLLDPSSASMWMWFKRYTYQVDEDKLPEYRKNIFGLRNKLAEKYNADLKPMYEVLIGKRLEKMPILDEPSF